MCLFHFHFHFPGPAQPRKGAAQCAGIAQASHRHRTEASPNIANAQPRIAQAWPSIAQLAQQRPAWRRPRPTFRHPGHRKDKRKDAHSEHSLGTYQITDSTEQRG